MRFFGDPMALTTPTGYATWKTMGALLAGLNASLAALVFALLALLLAQTVRTAGAAAGLAGAVMVLALLALVCGGASFPLFLRRDIGGVAWVRRAAHPNVSRSAALDLPYAARSLRAIWTRACRATAHGVLVDRRVGHLRRVDHRHRAEHRGHPRKILADLARRVGQALGSHNVMTGGSVG